MSLCLLDSMLFLSEVKTGLNPEELSQYGMTEKVSGEES